MEMYEIAGAVCWQLQSVDMENSFAFDAMDFVRYTLEWCRVLCISCAVPFLVALPFSRYVSSSPLKSCLVLVYLCALNEVMDAISSHNASTPRKNTLPG